MWGSNTPHTRQDKRPMIYTHDKTNTIILQVKEKEVEIWLEKTIFWSGKFKPRKRKVFKFVTIEGRDKLIEENYSLLVPKGGRK